MSTEAAPKVHDALVSITAHVPEDAMTAGLLGTERVGHGVRIPEGLVVGEDPVLDAKRFRVSERGICLITQDMIDRLG